ncbi:hypothetical protein [Flavobacterium johnsoniae]|uniref:hypothetical protein n=1 Tax=Flavobacterium johnsoniae TaxID=986 RepID=UPI00223BA1D2|nr:hypothetical protein [Flavobacterium johnsoniae]
MVVEKYNLDEMFKGWFIGNFEPSLYKTNEVEVGVKNIKRVSLKILIFIKLQLNLL